MHLVLRPQFLPCILALHSQLTTQLGGLMVMLVASGWTSLTVRCGLSYSEHACSLEYVRAIKALGCCAVKL